MGHADPWNETFRLESLLEADLLVQIERSKLRASAETFCVRSCRVERHCPLAGALHSKEQCPLWR